MPWKESCAVDERVHFVVEVGRGEMSKAGLCRQFGISRPTGEKWLRRSDAAGCGTATGPINVEMPHSRRAS